jgi:NAD(P)-dependent dehydrogenase (short-subunit alcohol dehydrogenase family)
MASGPASLDFDFPLGGKTAFVTGAASGIGAAIAEAFASKGVRVAVVDLDEDAAKAQAEKIGGCHCGWLQRCRRCVGGRSRKASA